MNEPNQNPQPTPPPAPPMIPVTTSPGWLPTGDAPLGSNSIEQTPIHGVVAAFEAVLRQPRRVMYQLRQPGAGGLVWMLLAISVLSALIYGVVVGTFSGGTQFWAAPVKIAGGLMVSALICLPSLYIFSCLGGSQARLIEVFGLIAGLLALMTVLLIGFAPVAWVFSASTKSLAIMGALHLVFWFVATIFGLRFIASGFRHFSASSDSGFKVWVVVFLLVAMQMTTALRPIVGTSDRFLPAPQDKKFFVGYWLESIQAETSAEAQGANAR